MQKQSATSLPSLSVRIDAEGRIGPGKIQLLENIHKFGSISAAVERPTGGQNGGGAALTAFGLSLVTRYRKIERDAASAVRKELAALRSDIGKPKKAAGR
jgi:molybdate transport system regulatory protein